MAMWRSSRKVDGDRDGEQARPSARDALSQLVVALQDLVTLLTPVHTARELRYEDVIGWFVDHRPPGDLARRGALLRKDRLGGEVEVAQVYLDGNSRIVLDAAGRPYGQLLIVDRLDEELTEAFGGKSLLIVD